MKYRGIIFDFNGVLLWDSHLHIQAWLELSEALRGSPFCQDELDLHMHGKSNKYIFEYLLRRPVHSQELPKLCDLKEGRYRELCMQNPQDFLLSPGAIELLESLIEKHIPYTIATFSPKENLDFFIEHLNLTTWFDPKKIVYDDGSHVDKSTMYQLAAVHLCLEPHHCIAIEDSSFGIGGAVRANMGKVIGLGPQETHSTLYSFGVHAAITSLTHFDTSEVQSGSSTV